MSRGHLIAAVLAGGLGTRLRPVVTDRPKVLADVGGRPFLSYLLDQLIAAGLCDVVLCTAYRAQQVKEAFGSAYRSLRIAYSEEPVPLGTAGALRFALPLFASQTVLVMNGDSFCDLDVGVFYDWHRRHHAQASLSLIEAAETGRFGRVRADTDGKVTAFEEKNTGGPGWINAGIYLLERSLIQTIPENSAVSLERTMLPAWVSQGLYGYRSTGKFLDIGTPESYAAAERFFFRSMPDSSMRTR